MTPPWKLVVDDLGRIGHAEIEARPLLLFVGGNNTGKTYLASLLWGLFSLRGGLPLAQGDAYRRCIAWIEERFARREQEPRFMITPETHADLVEVVNDTLREQGAALAERTFNRPGFKIGRLELRGVALLAEIPMHWRLRENAMGLSIGRDIGVTQLAQDASGRASTIEFLAKTYVPGALGFPVTMPGYHGSPIFLPASRTGFMLTYRGLAQQLVGDVLIKTDTPRPPVPNLTAPTIDFLKLLMGLTTDEGRFPAEAAFLERAMGGRLSLRADVGLPEVFYEHTEGKPPLPMDLSSALVTELAPVVLTLRHVAGYRVIIIEEPEAHLHPKLQRKLAQVVVRLVRKGLFVWITTHSENFCQQINNFMKLGSHPRRAEMQKKYGYEEMDYLMMDDVAGYQFEADPSSRRSIVKEMKKTEQGLVMPTFNLELAALTDEAIDLEWSEDEP